MNLKPKLSRLALIAAITAGVCWPLLNQIRSNRANAQTPPAAPDFPKGVAIKTFPDVPADKVVLTLGDQKFTAGEVKSFFSQLDPTTQENATKNPAWRREIANYLMHKLMADEAKREKLDQTSLFKTEYEQLLGKALMFEIANNTEANKKFFEANKDWFAQLKARHILIAMAGSPIESAKRTDAEARAKAEEIRKRLENREDFAAIARGESDDWGSAITGGDLGTMSRFQMVPSFEEAAYALKDNEISQPIKTQFGYHIIQVLGHVPANYDQIVQQVQRRRLDLLLDQLKKDNKAVVDESFFGPEEK